MQPNQLKPPSNYCQVMGRGCVLSPTSLRRNGSIHKPESSHVAVEVVEVDLPISHVSNSLIAAGRRATLWGPVGMGTLGGPHPRVCYSSGVPIPKVRLVRNC